MISAKTELWTISKDYNRTDFFRADDLMEDCVIGLCIPSCVLVALYQTFIVFARGIGEANNENRKIILLIFE
jgi:hypothetical protein